MKTRRKNTPKKYFYANKVFPFGSIAVAYFAATGEEIVTFGEMGNEEHLSGF